MPEKKSGNFSKARMKGYSRKEIPLSNGETTEEICIGYVTPNVLGMASPTTRRITVVKTMEIHWPASPKRPIKREAAKIEMLILTTSLLVTMVINSRR